MSSSSDGGISSSLGSRLQPKPAPLVEPYAALPIPYQPLHIATDHSTRIAATDVRISPFGYATPPLCFPFATSSAAPVHPLETFIRNAQLVERYRELTLHLAAMTRQAVVAAESRLRHRGQTEEILSPRLPQCPLVAKLPLDIGARAVPQTIPTPMRNHRKTIAGASTEGGAASENRKFRCDRCEKAYTTVGALKMHVRTHTLPCRCQLCGKAFSRPWLLQGHMRTHTGEKPFRCEHCQRAFADRSNLRAHLQTHSAVKRYRCDRCEKTFSRMSLLLKHQQTSCPNISIRQQQQQQQQQIHQQHP